MANTHNFKAIETIYNNYRFRSRLEARYAVYFDALNIRYEYEKEGFELNGIRYLPDFWLPEYRYWVEIKGDLPTDEELKKAEALYQHTGYPAIIFSFEPACSEGIIYYSIENRKGCKSELSTVNWIVCLLCNQVDINVRFYENDRLYNVHAPSEKIGLCSCAPFKYNEKGVIADANHVWNHPCLRDAEAAARGARFEFGEKGR